MSGVLGLGMGFVPAGLVVSVLGLGMDLFQLD